MRLGRKTYGWVVLMVVFLWFGWRWTHPPQKAMDIMADCAWNGKAKAWVDLNRDGKLDPGEPPLAGVAFLIDDVRNGYRKVGNPAVSNDQGEADLMVWIPGCPATEFEVYAEPPVGYKISGPQRMRPAIGATSSFGFRK